MTDGEKAIMTCERFQALLDAYGADLSRWPAEERLAAHAYAAHDAEAKNFLAEARALDRLLASLPETKPRLDLEAAILAGAQRVGRERQRPWSLKAMFALIWPEAAAWKPASVFVSAIILGVMLGLNVMSLIGMNGNGSMNEDTLADAVPFLSQDVSGL